MNAEERLAALEAAIEVARAERAKGTAPDTVLVRLLNRVDDLTEADRARRAHTKAVRAVLDEVRQRRDAALDSGT
jgi:hypothetical protein